MTLRQRMRATRLRRRVEKDQRAYLKYARVRLRRPPKPMRTPIVVSMAMLIVMIYYVVTMLLFKGVIVGFQEYVLLLMGCVFPATVIMVREGTISSVARTLKLEIGDAPGINADGFVPGQIVKQIRFQGTDSKGKDFDKTRHVELGWGGPIKRWPMKGRGPVCLLICQYGLDEKDFHPQAGFMMGDKYIVPLHPDVYRFDMLKASRDSRYADMIKATEEIGKRVHDRTWVVIGTRPMALPDRKLFPGPVVDDMELWHEKRLRTRATTKLHELGVDDVILKSVGLK